MATSASPVAVRAARAQPPAVRPGSGRMFDRIARRYDLLNRIFSLGLDQRWRRRTVAAIELRPGHRVLDLATGTGDLALAILRRCPSASVVGLDPSAAMLARAREKLGRERSLGVGVAEELPFADRSSAAGPAGSPPYPCAGAAARRAPLRRARVPLSREVDRGVSPTGPGVGDDAAERHRAARRRAPHLRRLPSLRRPRGGGRCAVLTSALAAPAHSPDALTIITLPVAEPAPSALSLPDLLFWWAPRDGGEVAGTGVAAEVTARGPDRFAEVERRAAEILARVAVPASGAGSRSLRGRPTRRPGPTSATPGSRCRACSTGATGRAPG